METVTRVVDQFGGWHTLVRRLGAGGQGEVWLTANGRRIVKLLHSRARPEAVQRQIAFVKRAKLDDLHVARPLALLRPPALGYVAEFLEEMSPIRSLFDPRPELPTAEWHVRTGGLRRRLRLLAHAGEALAGLHAAGLCYGDLSDSNVFVSDDPAAHEAWLIDLDNLRHETDPSVHLHTRYYGAPEVVTGQQGLSSLSDAWSFAVLVVQTLRLVHPFEGDAVDEDADLLNDALAGELPWIDDPEDRRNGCAFRGLRPELVYSTQILRTAQKTFGPGRRDRLARASVSEWVDVLHAAADATARCLSCAATFYARSEPCPWCGEPLASTVVVRFYQWLPGDGLVAAAGTRALFLLDGSQLAIPRRVAHRVGGSPGREPAATLTPADRGVVLRAIPPGTVWLSERDDVSASKSRPVPARGTTLALGSIQKSPVIHFGPADEPHRVAVVGTMP